ncbi:MAG: 2-succinyl-6-hydroxy-2,4-cyclohexadiene-1-carboxylate synthase [Aquificales bacterium]|nr:2-succinyl-6-hydroxy-2,4-cyclohexadiene-1-carboxylate synthase [Aquificales bacterium]
MKSLTQNKRPFLLLLHGFTGSAQSWQPLLPALTPYFQVITPDILGHGRSPSPPSPRPYQMTQIAASLITLLDQHTSQPAHLLGYSMGGRLALYLAVHYPKRFHSLILESASPGLKTAVERDERRQRDNTLANRIERDSIEAFIDFWERLPLWASQQQLSKETHARLRQQRLQNNPAGLANSLRGMGTGVQSSLWQNLQNVQLPVLLMTGELDHKFIGIAQEMAPLLPLAQHITIPDAGHTIHLEKPTQYTQNVVSFLKNIEE